MRATLNNKSQKERKPVNIEIEAPGNDSRSAAPMRSRAQPHATADQVQARAYEIYLNRNGSGEIGDAMSDWLQAERELNGATAPGKASQ